MSKSIILCISLLIILFYSGCSGNGASILYIAENEKPIFDNNLPNDISISTMVSMNNAFFVAGGRMYRKDHDEIEWTLLSSPGTGTTLVTRVVAYASYLLCFGVQEQNSSYGLFVSNDYGSTWGNMIDISGTVGAENRIQDVFSENSRVFLSTGPDISGDVDPKEYSLYEITGISDINTISVSPSAGFTGLENRIIDLAIDPSNTIWAITGAGLVSYTGSNFPDNMFYSGIHYSTTFNRLFIAMYSKNGNGRVYRHVSGSTWEADTESLDTTTDFADITVYDSLGSPIQALTLGTTGSGYLEKLLIDEYFKKPEETATDNYSNYNLSRILVHRLASFEVNSEFVTFALSKEGLWMNDALGWNRE